MWIQKRLTLKARSRGFHLITDDILQHVPELGLVELGLLHVFIQHSSASLTITENADPDVRRDMESHFNRMVPEEAAYRHGCEGPDDMPAHIKSSLLGASLTIPISHGRLALGTWQGICLCEHRDSAAGRALVLTIQGQAATPR